MPKQCNEEAVQSKKKDSALTKIMSLREKKKREPENIYCMYNMFDSEEIIFLMFLQSEII